LPAHVYIEDLDLESIIANQPRLRLLGIYCGEDDETVFAERIKPLFESSSRRLRIPTIFALGRFCWDIRLNWTSKCLRLTMLPLSHHPGEALQECRKILTLLSKYHKVHYVRHVSFKLLGITEENISLLEEVMEAMVTCLQNYGKCCEYVNISMSDTTIQVSFPLSRCLPTFIIL
jgi:hypothetical protein